MLRWGEPDQRAWGAAREASGMGGKHDAVCGAECFLAQLEALKNVIEPEESPGDEQDKVGDSTCAA